MVAAKNRSAQMPQRKWATDLRWCSTRIETCSSIIVPSSLHRREQHVAVHVVTRARGKKDCGAGDLVGIAPASRGNAFKDLAVARFVSLQHNRETRTHVAG